MPLLSQGGCIKDLFVTEEELIDRFTGQELWVWGINSTGNLSTGDRLTKNEPTKDITQTNDWKQVSAGGSMGAGIKTDGTLWVWGDGAQGQLGTNNVIDVSSPVQTISGGTNWKTIDASLAGSHTAGIKTDGTLWLWGNAGSGQLGDNTTADKSSPVQTVPGGTNWKQVSLGCLHSSAIKTDGTLWLWGRGFAGLLGDNSFVNKSSPVQTISGGNNWKQVSLGLSHSSAIKTDGTLWLWGCGSLDGELGNNSVLDQSSPVQTISGGTDWKQVSLGCAFSAAIKTNGTLWLWGQNVAGHLGDNSIEDKSSPVQTVSGGTNWRQVSLGVNHSVALKTDGSLWVWGCAGIGALGIGASCVNQSSPVQTVSGGTNWRSSSSDRCFTLALRIREY